MKPVSVGQPGVVVGVVDVVVVGHNPQVLGQYF